MTKKDNLVARINALLAGVYETEKEARNARIRIYRARAHLARLDPFNPVHAKVFRIERDEEGRWRIVDSAAKEKGDALLEELKKWLSQP